MIHLTTDLPERPDPLADWLTLTQAADRLGIKRNSLYQHLHRHHPPGFRRFDGRHWIVHRDDLETLIEKFGLPDKGKPLLLS